MANSALAGMRLTTALLGQERQPDQAQHPWGWLQELPLIDEGWSVDASVCEAWVNHKVGSSIHRQPIHADSCHKACTRSPDLSQLGS